MAQGGRNFRILLLALLMLCIGPIARYEKCTRKPRNTPRPQYCPGLGLHDARGFCDFCYLN
jgi:hypothetical protein